MDLQQRYKKVTELLNAHNQSHLLKFCSELDDEQCEKLLAQIGRLDFKHIDNWVEMYVKNSSAPNVPTNPKSAPFYPAVAANAREQAKYDKAKRTGRELISSGKVAAFTVAGGQGRT